MSTCDVLFAMTGECLKNSRALRHLRILSDLELDVAVLAFDAVPQGQEAAALPGITIHQVDRPGGSGPPFFARLHWRMRKAASEVTARVYHASDLYVLPALHAAAKLHDGHLVYDARECYPHVEATSGHPMVRRFWQALEGWHVHEADAVFTVSESIAGHMSTTYGIRRPTVLYNAPETTGRPPRRGASDSHDNPGTSSTLREKTGAGGVLLLHQGRMAPGRGCNLLVEAMRGIDNGSLLFLGDGDLRPALEQKVEELGIQNKVHFVDPVPPDELLPVTASADVGITLLQDTCLNHRYALPNKLFEYLTAGLAVLGSNLTEIRRVIETHDAGLLVTPSDLEALQVAMQRMIDDDESRRRWSRNAAAAMETYDPEKSSKRLREAYRTILAEPPA